jgi:hypothetical protein
LELDREFEEEVEANQDEFKKKLGGKRKRLFPFMNLGF